VEAESDDHGRRYDEREPDVECLPHHERPGITASEGLVHGVPKCTDRAARRVEQRERTHEPERPRTGGDAVQESFDLLARGRVAQRQYVHDRDDDPPADALVPEQRREPRSEQEEQSREGEQQEEGNLRGISRPRGARQRRGPPFQERPRSLQKAGKFHAQAIGRGLLNQPVGGGE
jgi:hypothetical protein